MLPFLPQNGFPSRWATFTSQPAVCTFTQWGQVAKAHKPFLWPTHNKRGEASGGTRVTTAPGLGETAQPVGRRAAARAGVVETPLDSTPGAREAVGPHPGWELMWKGAPCGARASRTPL